jgi:hypothetical protein
MVLWQAGSFVMVMNWGFHAGMYLCQDFMVYWLGFWLL